MSQTQLLRRLNSELIATVGGLDDMTVQQRSTMQLVIDKLKPQQDLEASIEKDKVQLERLYTFSEAEQSAARLGCRVYALFQDCAVLRGSMSLAAQDFVLVFRASAIAIWGASSVEEVRLAQDRNGVSINPRESDGSIMARLSNTQSPKRTPLGAKYLDAVPGQLRRLASEMFGRLSGRLCYTESLVAGLEIGLIVLCEEGVITEEERRFTSSYLVQLMGQALTQSVASGPVGDSSLIVHNRVSALGHLLDSYPNRVPILGLLEAIQKARPAGADPWGLCLLCSLTHPVPSTGIAGHGCLGRGPLRRLPGRGDPGPLVNATVCRSQGPCPRDSEPAPPGPRTAAGLAGGALAAGSLPGKLGARDPGYGRRPADDDTDRCLRGQPWHRAGLAWLSRVRARGSVGGGTAGPQGPRGARPREQRWGVDWSRRAEALPAQYSVHGPGAGQPGQPGAAAHRPW